mgnify:CR=1 FL=1
MRKKFIFSLVIVFTGIISAPVSLSPSVQTEVEIMSVYPMEKVPLPRLFFRLERVKKESTVEVEATVTAYTSNPGDKTFLETEPGPGTVAVDPDFIPLGSTVTFPGVTFLSLPKDQKTFKAVDRGTKVKGWKIDVWMPSKKEADDFGIQKLGVKIIKPLAG